VVVSGLAKICRDAETALQRVRHAPWTTSVIERSPGWLIIGVLMIH